MTPTSLRQYVLPYRNYSRDTEGWQFGMPPKQNDLSHDNLSVLSVHRDGGFFRAGSFSITPPQETRPNQNPLPHWLWIPVRQDGQTQFARVTRPREGPGSVPLSSLRQSDRERIYTAEGLQHVGLHHCPTDLPESFSFTLRGETEVSVGGVIFADAIAKGGNLLWIRPEKASYKLDLWTSHLIRLLELQVLGGDI